LVSTTNPFALKTDESATVQFDPLLPVVLQRSGRSWISVTPKSSLSSIAESLMFSNTLVDETICAHLK
jgi:hypothetical protein